MGGSLLASIPGSFLDSAQGQGSDTCHAGEVVAFFEASAKYARNPTTLSSDAERDWRAPGPSALRFHPLGNAKSPYLNLFGPFRERGADTLDFKGGDAHWNETGQDFAAELARDAIVGHHWLD